MSRIIYGINPVAEAIKGHPERIQRIHYAGSSSAIKEMLREGSKAGIKFFEEKRSGLDELAGSAKHQGVVAILSDFQYAGVDEILKDWKKSGEKAFIVILDGIQDPHNLGAIIRSAEGAGVHGIIIPRDRAVGVTPAVEKASAGAVQHVKVARVTNIARTVEKLKGEGLWIIGAKGSCDKSLYNVDLDMDIAFVIGSEGKGIRPLVSSKCDFLLAIPMRGRINSLNASVSAAIVMYEVVRQRGTRQAEQLCR